MPSYEITAVHPDPRPWKAQGKFDMLEYRVDLRGPNSEGATVDIPHVEWSRKKESPAPRVGQTLDVEKFESKQQGLKLHLAQQLGGGSRNGDAPGRFEKQPTHPKDAARMGVAHSDEMALTALAVMERLKVLTADQVGSTREFFELVDKTSAWFKRRVDEAGEQAQ